MSQQEGRLFHIVMQSMSGVLLTLFFSPFFALSHSLQCDDATQRMEGERCCNKCQPGERVVERCSASGPTRCVPCGPGYYSNKYNVEWSCHKCKDCSMIRPASSTWSTQYVIIVCCCALLTFVILVSRNKNVLRWNWWTTKGFRVKEEAPEPHQCSEEEGKMPVQEVCEKLQREENVFY
ncbi:hypothetical protein SKAU_G00225330 [Synaphobranchus kaupii]|uniref:Uncharacterized protein n=1 Tax=Synaphobranchus kaupii TaxID=118154 RepID=A0A9Q1FC22_SYNKA|nr:hypothetical protein SKAU_G00225330 [Synaphobranchus kaupii]